MKKILLTLLSGYICSVVMAQITYGPKLGLNAFKESTHYSGSASGSQKPNSSSLIGFQAGGVLNYQVINNFSIRPEILFERVGFKNDATVSFANAEFKARVSYLSVPINFVGMMDVGPGKINVFAGPQFSLGLGGKTHTSSTVSIPFFGTQTTEQDAKLKPGKDNGQTSSNTGYYNPLNISLNFGVGYQYKRFLLTGQYNAGLTNFTAHSTNSSEESSRKNTVVKLHGFTFGLTYFFGSLEK